MLTKKFKKNLILGYLFLGIIGGVTIIPLLERWIFKEKSIFNNLYKNIFMGPFNYYGYGIMPKNIIEYEFYWEHILENKKKEFLSNLKYDLKEHKEFHNIDIINKKNELIIYSEVNLNKILNKYKNINYEKKYGEYRITINKSLLAEWKQKIFFNVKKFLQLKYYNKSCVVKVINDNLLQLTVYTDKNVKEINLAGGPIKAYGIITDNNISSNKRIMIGGTSPFPVFKNVVFDRTMIKNIQWLDHENSNLLKLSLHKEALDNIDNLKKYNIDTIILVTEILNFNQKEFNGFKPINTENETLLGLLKIQKGGGVNNFIIQTLWDDNTKMILDKYFNNYSFEGNLILKNIIMEPPLLKNNSLKLLLIAILLLVILLAVALFFSFSYGFISALDLISSTMFLIFLIRFFDLVFDLRIIFMMIFFIVFLFFINCWRNFKIKNQNLSLVNDNNLMIRKQLYQSINKIINFYNLGVFSVILPLFLIVDNFSEGFKIILMANIIIFCSQNFFWNNWILYYTVKELNKNIKF
jgi:hypothetical protein